MANIIRNAFQYTHQGEVRIALSGMQVEIDNEDDSTMQGDIDENDSYSIGLNLCDQICRKLGWDMKLAPTNGGMRVKLNFHKLGQLLNQVFCRFFNNRSEGDRSIFACFSCEC